MNEQVETGGKNSDAGAARLIKVYKTRRKLDMYLYVDFGEDLERVPEALLRQFGEPELALSLNLTGSRKLARVAARDVLSAVESKGYYLQMPPADGGIDMGLGGST